MKNQGMYLLALSVLYSIFFGCDNNENLTSVTYPQKAILGKWEIIENSSGPISYPGAYREFQSDSVLFDYVDENDFSYSKYWFADSLLYIRHVYIDQVSGDTILVSALPYRFEFIAYNKLKLEFQIFVQIPTHIYKRVK